jgi:competence protein ComEA
MAIDDFEWQGEITEPSRARLAEAAAARSWLSRLRQSVWLEPAARLLGMGALLGVLAGIGVVATTYAKPGKPLPEGPQALAAALGTSWLKPTPAEPQPSAPPPAHAHPTPAPTHGLLQSAPHAAPSASTAPSGEPSAGAGGGNAGAVSGVLADGRIVLNAASAAELTRLPGVGARRAEAIIALRTKLKRFKQPTDLLRVKGIGPRGLKRMLPHLVLDAP